MVIISTPSFLPYSHKKTGIFIIEEDGSHQYRSGFRPSIDLRYIIEAFAAEYHLILIRAGSVLSLATHKRLRDKELQQTAGLRVRIEKDRVSIVAPSILEQDRLHPLFVQNVEHAQKKGLRTLVIVPRRGIATVTVCRDCSYIVSCPDCKTPLVLHERKKGPRPERIYICHVCKKEVIVTDTCPECGGWRLAPYGAGTEKIQYLLNEKFPHFDMVTIDDETLASKKNRELILRWYSTPGSILVGTPALVPYLAFYPPDETHMVSFDSYFSYPSYMMNEYMLHFGVLVSEITKERVLLYASPHETRVKRALLSSFLSPAIRDELQEREQFQLPPYFILLKIEVFHKEGCRDEAVLAIEDRFKEFQIEIFHTKRHHPEERQSITALVSIPEKSWMVLVENEVLREFREKGTSYADRIVCEINPEQLFY